MLFVVFLSDISILQFTPFYFLWNQDSFLILQIGHAIQHFSNCRRMVVSQRQVAELNSDALLTFCSFHVILFIDFVKEIAMHTEANFQEHSSPGSTLSLPSSIPHRQAATSFSCLNNSLKLRFLHYSSMDLHSLIFFILSAPTPNTHITSLHTSKCKHTTHMCTHICKHTPHTCENTHIHTATSNLSTSFTTIFD
jgi:hypothetical protein